MLYSLIIANVRLLICFVDVWCIFYTTSSASCTGVQSGQFGSSGVAKLGTWKTDTNEVKCWTGGEDSDKARDWSHS